MTNKLMRLMAITIFCMITFLITGCSFNKRQLKKDEKFIAGTYETDIMGHNTNIKLAVTVDKSTIKYIEILEHSETSGIADPALEQIPRRIIEGQTLAVDAISSCTITSVAILDGVKQALTEAGADIESLVVKKETFQEEEKIVKETDVIVVGGGLAGLAAATTVTELGGSVIVIEKMENCGGNTMRSGGTLNAVDPERQLEQGIVDSLELYIKNTYEGGGEKGNLELIRKLCENSKSARDWISSYGGEWQDSIYLTIGGRWPRSLDAKNNATETLIDPLIKVIKNNNGEIIVNCKAEELIMDDGKVIGVKAYDTNSKKKYELYGNNGVILATGGFSANSDMVSQYNDTIPEDNPTTNSPSATGDGIIMGQSVGANIIDMENILLHPHSGTNVYFSGMIDNSIYVNQLGKRFVNEQLDRNEVCQEILEQPGAIVYAIFDSNVINEEFWSTQDGYQDFVELAKAGKCGYGETLDELAESIGVNPIELEKSVREFNQAVDGLIEDEFGRELFYKKIEDGPFYASIRSAYTHYTIGGLEIDSQARVKNINGDTIPGLYAAGEVTGGIHGENRLGGNSLTECIVFGRSAGESILGSSNENVGE